MIYEDVLKLAQVYTASKQGASVQRQASLTAKPKLCAKRAPDEYQWFPATGLGDGAAGFLGPRFFVSTPVVLAVCFLRFLCVLSGRSLKYLSLELRSRKTSLST